MYTKNPNDRIAIFIDGENIHYSAKHMNMRLDYLKLCERLAGPRRLVRSYFYTAVSTQSEGKIDFINFLKLNGFKVVIKEIKSFNENDAVNRSIRSSLDMEMAIDVLEMAPHLDSVILCTGDGDFTSLVEALGVLDSCSLDRNRLISSLSLSVAEVKTGLSRIVGTFTVGEARVDECSL